MNLDENILKQLNFAKKEGLDAIYLNQNIRTKELVVMSSPASLYSDKYVEIAVIHPSVYFLRHKE